MYTQKNIRGEELNLFFVSHKSIKMLFYSFIINGKISPVFFIQFLDSSRKNIQFGGKKPFLLLSLL